MMLVGCGISGRGMVFECVEKMEAVRGKLGPNLVMAVWLNCMIYIHERDGRRARQDIVVYLHLR